MSRLSIGRSGIEGSTEPDTLAIDVAGEAGRPVGIVERNAFLVRMTDFTPGADKLDLRALFEASGYAGSDPVADGRLAFRDNGSGDTQVYFDPDAPDSGDWPWLITTLAGVQPREIAAGDWLFR